MKKNNNNKDNETIIEEPFPFIEKKPFRKWTKRAIINHMKAHEFMEETINFAKKMSRKRLKYTALHMECIMNNGRFGRRVWNYSVFSECEFRFLVDIAPTQKQIDDFEKHIMRVMKDNPTLVFRFYTSQIETLCFEDEFEENNVDHYINVKYVSKNQLDRIKSAVEKHNSKIGSLKARAKKEFALWHNDYTNSRK